jgi:hypothetical protein
VVGIRAFDHCGNADDAVDLTTLCCPSEQPVLFDSCIERNRKRNLVRRKIECALARGVGCGPDWGVPNDAKPNKRAS